ncbi:hypothetical protein KUCAC02_004577, partial [Chaenocephalus aceratus]
TERFSTGGTLMRCREQKQCSSRCLAVRRPLILPPAPSRRHHHGDGRRENRDE